MRNTGQKGFNRLRERNITTGELTGITKVNVSTDPDYVAPVYDPAYCEEGPLYINPNKTTFSVIQGANTININIQSNTEWISFDTSQFISFPSGNTGIHDGVLSVEITANTGSTVRNHVFNIQSADGSVIVSITINQAAAITLKQINLGVSLSFYTPCNSNFQGIYYIDTSDIETASVLYKNSAGTKFASGAFYSTGIKYRYWTGSAWNGLAQKCSGW